VETTREGLPPALRPWAVGALSLLLLAVALPLVLGSPATALVPSGLTWWVLAPAFAVAEVVVWHVQLRRDHVTVSFGEVPLVVGLVLLPPAELVLASVVGSAAALVVRRPGALKTLFNLCLFAVQAAVAARLLHALLDGAPVVGLPGVAAVLVTVLVTDLVSALAVTAVVWTASGQLDGGVVREALTVSAAATAAGTSVALLVLGLAHSLPAALVPLAVVVVVLVAAHRDHARLRRDHERLEDLHRLSARFSSPTTGRRALAELVLREARDVMAAATAEMAWDVADGSTRGWLRLEGDRVLCGDAPPEGGWWSAAVVDGRAVVRPATRGEGASAAVPLGEDMRQWGVLVVGGRSRAGGRYTAQDLRQLRLVADQAAVALQRAHLLELLRTDLAEQERVASTDALTGTPNRAGLLGRLGAALLEGPTAVLVVDLDGFSDVNEALGHDVGDQALRAVVRRLERGLGQDGAVVARLGDDEFGVLMPGAADASDVVRRSEALLTGLSRAEPGDPPVDLSATGGLALGEPGDHAASLVHRAETALAGARAEHHPLRLWSARDEARAARRLALVGALRTTIADGGLDVVYQPVVDPVSGALLGAEALVRWTSGEHGSVPPDEFVPLAERSGLVQPLTAVVLRRALADAARWRRSHPGFVVAVNLSPRVLQQPGCAADVAGALVDAGLPASALVLEITETAALADLEQSLLALGELRALGVRLSVDDFGTGHSSLAYLQVLPVGEVKIDRSFVATMLEDAGSAAIVRAAVRLGKDLGMHLVAEGVEDAETLAALARLGVDAVQGYHLARPMPATAFDAWVRGRRCPALPSPRAGQADERAPDPAAGAA